MDIITIDPSLSCTAICINGRFYVYATNSTALTKSGKLSSWFEKMDQYVDYRFFDPIDSGLSYSHGELAKLNLYDKITDSIISDISLNLISSVDEAIVCIEGYSYSSATRALIDLVTFSSLLRKKLISEIGAKLVVISPSTLKVKSCELTYGKRISDKGKKLPCMNLQEISGGRFKKAEMMNALLDNDNLYNDWYVNLLLNDFSDILNMKKIPKPIEDMNDAKLMYEIVLDIAKSNDYILDLIESKLLD